MTGETPTIGDLRRQTAARLRAGGIDRAVAETDWLLGGLLDLDRSGLILADGEAVDPALVRRLHSLIARRLAGEPLQYLLGETEFWSLTFAVGPEVLIPRPETEFVCEQALATLKQERVRPARLADLGTGSGCIATVMARELGTRVLAIDHSLAALGTARKNFRRHRVTDLVQPLCADLFSGLADRALFEVIISNPPYVAERERSTLDVSVREFEPAEALFAGEDGLDCYRRLIPASVSRLVAGGWLFLEIGWQQGGAVAELCRQAGFHRVETVNDYGQRPRFVRARHP